MSLLLPCRIAQLSLQLIETENSWGGNSSVVESINKLWGVRTVGYYIIVQLKTTMSNTYELHKHDIERKKILKNMYCVISFILV